MSGNFERQLRSVLEARPPRRVRVEGARAAAVLIPIVGGDRPALLFTVRTDTLPSHKGQISFPGGSVDPADESTLAAALREANEEIGLEPSHVGILGELDALPTFVSGYVISPFVGWLEEHPKLEPNPQEVAEVLVVPVGDFVEDIRAAPGFEHGGRSYPTEAWIWEDHVIWGVTARLVRVLLDRLADAGLAARPGEAPEWPEA